MSIRLWSLWFLSPSPAPIQPNQILWAVMIMPSDPERPASHEGEMQRVFVGIALGLAGAICGDKVFRAHPFRREEQRRVFASPNKNRGPVGFLRIRRFLGSAPL